MTEIFNLYERFKQERGPASHSGRPLESPLLIATSRIFAFVRASQGNRTPKLSLPTLGLGAAAALHALRVVLARDGDINAKFPVVLLKE